MTTFIRNDNSVSILNKDAELVTDRLEPANYVLKFAPLQGFFLDIVDDFVVPDKIYGDTEITAQRILNTYQDRPNKNTGVLLVGNKGSGKTLLAKMISEKATKENIPTILINDNFDNTEFITVIQSITQPCVVIFDEFEKNYNKEEQGYLLTMLDGVFNGSKLFIFTSNSKWQICDYMFNRPGRIYYSIEYKSRLNCIDEYCRDNLNNKNYINDILAVAGLVDDFNFDMLQQIVEETNRYNESPLHLYKILNIKPEFSTDFTFKIRVWEKKELMKTEGPIKYNPLGYSDCRIHFYDAQNRLQSLYLEQDKLVSADSIKGIFEYKLGAFKVVLERTTPKSSWDDV